MPSDKKRLILRRKLTTPAPRVLTFQDLAVGEFFRIADKDGMGLKEKLAPNQYKTYWTPITTSTSTTADALMPVIRAKTVEDVEVYLGRTGREIHG